RPRLALIVNVFNSFFNYEMNVLNITKDTVLNAEKRRKYFIANAKKIKIETGEKKAMQANIKAGKNNAEKIKAMYAVDKDFNRTRLAQLLEVSVQYVRKVVKEIETGNK